MSELNFKIHKSLQPYTDTEIETRKDDPFSFPVLDALLVQQCREVSRFDRKIHETKDQADLLGSQIASLSAKFAFAFVLIGILTSVVLISSLGATFWFLILLGPLIGLVVHPIILEVLHGLSSSGVQLQSLNSEIKRLEGTKRKLTAEKEKQEEKIRTKQENAALEIISRSIGELAKSKARMVEIETEVKFKRKWRPEFDSFDKIAEQHKRSDKSALSRLGSAAAYIRHESDIANKLHTRFLDGIRYLNYSWLENRLASLRETQFGTPEQITQSSTSQRSLARAVVDPKPIEQNTIVETRPPSNAGQKANDAPSVQVGNQVEVTEEQASHSSVSRLEPVDAERQPTLFDSRSANAPQTNWQAQDGTLTYLGDRNRRNSPQNQRRTPKYQKFKISNELRQKIAERKTQIGALGELAVVEFERHRLLDPERVKHISLFDDSRGYDIESWKGDEPIYIEVKTTVGSFWSNLYLTQNEFRAMDELGEQYFLYRVCNFDIATGAGELFIYGGKNFIEEVFEFKTKVYVLSERWSESNSDL